MAADITSRVFWQGLRSYIFHVSADSLEDTRIRKVRALLNYPGLCVSIEELSGKDASHAMEEDYKDMQADVHSLRVGQRRLHNPHKRYAEEVSELGSSIERSGKKIFRVKVLVDADLIDRPTVDDIIHKTKELL